jgi:hypothetical protein
MIEEMTQERAAKIRDRFHAEGNRFGMMSRYHKQMATFMLGAEAAKHLVLADKWALGQHLSYCAASEIVEFAEIPEYGRAWDERLLPDDLEKAMS